jgi:hypothetical protein
MQHLIEQQLNLMIAGRFEESWKLSEQIEIEYPDEPKSKFNRGWHLMQQGNYEEGLKCLEYGRKLGVYGTSNLPENYKIWDKSDLQGKTVVLYLDSTVTQSIMYLRFASKIWEKGATCIVCCHKSLQTLVYKVPGVSKCIDYEELSSIEHDFLILSTECINLFDCDISNIPNEPYVFARQESVNLWDSILKTEKNKKVGIYWNDNLDDNKQVRWFDPEQLINLYNVNDNLQFYSLQKQENSVQLPEDILDIQHFIISLEDMIACIENLDLVITTSCSVGHISAAMGKPTWLILPILCEPLLAFGQETTPWYQNTTKIFRQKQFRDWNSVFDQIKCELNKL